MTLLPMQLPKGGVEKIVDETVAHAVACTLFAKP